MGFPKQVGHCVAGERLFGVVYPNIYVCPVNLTLVAGTIQADGAIAWDKRVQKQLMHAKQHPEFGGCIGVAYPHSAKIRKIFQTDLLQIRVPNNETNEDHDRSSL